MFRAPLVAFALAALVGMAGCGRNKLPANASPPKDRAELESRYDALSIGVPESEVAAFMGKNGAAVAGYSTQPVKGKPEGGSVQTAPGESDKYWASADGTSAIQVVFG